MKNMSMTLSSTTAKDTQSELTAVVIASKGSRAHLSPYTAELHFHRDTSSILEIIFCTRVASADICSSHLFPGGLGPGAPKEDVHQLDFYIENITINSSLSTGPSMISQHHQVQNRQQWTTRPSHNSSDQLCCFQVVLSYMFSFLHTTTYASSHH